MGIRDIFSTRNKPAPDVWTYDLPNPLRVQLVHIFSDTIPRTYDGWHRLAADMAKEHGLFQLPSDRVGHLGDRTRPPENCMKYILEQDTPKSLDMIEALLQTIQSEIAPNPHYSYGASQKPADALAEVNERFRRTGVGYQYEQDAGKLIKIDSMLVHAEVVKPALALLAKKQYAGANAEYLTAYEHLRHARNEDAIVGAGKAFESTMKAICDQRGWPYAKDKATASTLIKLILDKGLVPGFSQEQLMFLDKLLTGLPTVRNKNGGHGAGATPRDVDDHLAAYALHMAAANILFLIERHEAKK